MAMAMSPPINQVTDRFKSTDKNKHGWSSTVVEQYKSTYSSRKWTDNSDGNDISDTSDSKPE